MRIGLGFDAHRLVAGRPLVLGGVEIDHHLGLWGHSDADVLTHAIGDALLGAAGLGDLGRHFPDTDPAFKDVSSLRLLQRIMEMVRERGFRVVNVDATVMAERPKLAPHMVHMAANLAPILGVPPAEMNLKATTTEKMGFTGREEGIAAMAVVLVEKV